MIQLNLTKIQEKITYIERRLQSIVGLKPNQIQALNKEFSYFKSLEEYVLQEKISVNAIHDANEMLHAEGLDSDMKSYLNQEVVEQEIELTKTRAKINKALVPPASDDDANVILELRAGTGGDEAALFVEDCLKMYRSFAEENTWKFETLSFSESDRGGFKEYIAVLSGRNTHKLMKYESGTHRVQRVPETETQGRIHTSAITVAIMKEPTSYDDIHIDPKDLQIETQRASGAGGQHVNTTDSAVRMRHIPTGIVVYCQQEKSQHKNKDQAFRILKSRYKAHLENQQNDERSKERQSQVGSGDRSQRIRTYNYPQNRVTDHRIGFKTQLDKVISGDVSELLDTLIQEDAKDLIQQKISEMS
jgi:peptide chain release factor 1